MINVNLESILSFVADVTGRAEICNYNSTLCKHGVRICVNELETHLIQKTLYCFVLNIINIKYPKVFLKLSTKVYGRNVPFVYGYLFCPKTTWLQWPALPFTTEGLLLTSKYFTWPNPWEGESSPVVLFTKDKLLISMRPP